jgi:glycosyltransferase involved in cell wall biosynthesis
MKPIIKYWARVTPSPDLSKSTDLRTDLVILVAPFCHNPKSHWFSPGRYQKLHQVEELLTSFSFSLFRINTAPEICYGSHIPHLHLSTSSFPLMRLSEGLCVAILFLLGKPFKTHNPKLWIYNTRVNEALIAFLFLLFIPSAQLILQIEDLPGARSKNTGLRGLLDFICLNILVRRASHVFVVSSVVRQTLQMMVKTAIPLSSVLPPFLTPGFLAKVCNRPQPFAHQKTTILYAGGYSPEKGVHELIDAFTLLHSDNYVLQLIGPIPAYLASRLASNHRIDIIGKISSDELYYFYSMADIVVCPHLVTKSSSHIFPFKLIEYASCGALPLVTPMPGVEVLRLPPVCIYSSVEELVAKLSASYSIWAEHQHELAASASILRDSYSFQSVRSSLAPHLV